MNKTVLAAALTAAFALTAPFASAQNADIGSPAAESIVVAQATPQTQAAQGQRQARREFQLPSQRVEARLTQMKTALKITDAQNNAWENFAGVMRNQARSMDQRFQARKAAWDAAKAQGGDPRAQRPQVSAIERLERRQQRLQEASARMNDVIAAAKPLYASFSPEQKQIADKMLAQHGHGHHGRGGEGGHRMHDRAAKPAA